MILFSRRTIVVAAFGLAALLAASAAPAHAKTPSGKSIIKDVQKAFKDLDSFTCKFRLEFTWAMVNETETTEGTMALAKDDRFRYESPSQLMVTDGTTLWRYSPQNGQAIIENLKDVQEDVLPRDILFDYPKKFDVQEVSKVSLDGRPTWEMSLIPKEGGLGVEKVTVWVDEVDSITRKMEYTDDSGNRTVYTIYDVKINPEIPDSRFTLTLPDSVKVFDLR